MSYEKPDQRELGKINLGEKPSKLFLLNGVRPKIKGCCLNKLSFWTKTHYQWVADGAGITTKKIQSLLLEQYRLESHGFKQFSRKLR